MITAPEISLPDVRGEYKFTEPLSKYTWLGVGGAAEIMFFPADIADLCFFLKNKSSDLDVCVIGGGSNLLVRDGGVKGVVVKLQNKSFSAWHVQDDVLYCGAGLLNVNLQKVIVDNGLGGLEFLCSIPGTLGGAACGNAGCFNHDISQVLVSATAVDGKGNIITIGNKDFNFSYRRSNLPQDWIICEVGLRFMPCDGAKAAEIIENNRLYRRAHQPQGIKTAGSTFKNTQNMAAWQLIKNSGADGLEVGGVRLSPQHCNFLDNYRSATAADVESLCKQVIGKVREYSGVTLEMEIKTIGRELTKDGC